MNQNIIDVINSLGETDKLYFVGEVDLSEIVQAAEALNVEFAKDFVEYTHKFGSISVGSIELCGIDEESRMFNCRSNIRYARIVFRFSDGLLCDRIGWNRQRCNGSEAGRKDLSVFAWT